MGPYGVLWGAVGRCGALWVPMGCYGSLCGAVGRYGALWFPMGLYGALWGAMVPYGALWGAVGRCGALWGADPPAVLHSTCSDFSHGTALHIAASNLCIGAVRCLLEHGADPALRVGGAMGRCGALWGDTGEYGALWGTAFY